MTILPTTLVVATCGISLLLLGFMLITLFRQEINNIIAYRQTRACSFNCMRCCDCCKKTVILSRNDCRRLAESGIELDYASFKVFGFIRILRKKDDICIFCRQKFKDGIMVSECSIYEYRPDVCRRFPFITYPGFKGADKRCKFIKKQVKEKRVRHDRKSR